MTSHASQYPVEAGWQTDYRDTFDGPPTPPAIQLDIISAADFADLVVPDRPWLVKDLIPDRSVTLLGGDGGVGKSLLAKQLAVAVASRGDWLGALPEFGPAIYLSAEDDRDEIHRRLADIVAAQGISLEDLDDLHILPLAGRDAVLGAPARKSGVIEPTPLWSAVVDKLDLIKPRLFVIDNLADVFAGNENARPEARQFVGLLRGAAIEFNLAVVILGHPSLTGISSGTGASGSTAWTNSVRSRLYLDRVKSDDGDEPDTALRVLKTMKSNYGPIGADIRLRWDKGFFRTEGGGGGMFDRIAADARAERLFVDLLRSHVAQGRDVSANPSPNYAPTVFAASRDAKGTTKRMLREAMDRLFTAEKISIESYGPSSRRRSRLVLKEDEN